MLARPYGEAGVSRKHWIWAAVLAVVVIALGASAFALRDPVTFAKIATGYAAKQTCSCRHVSGRTLDSCMADYPQDARGQITVVETGDKVRASVLFGLIHAEAQYEDGYGCRLLD